MIATPLTYLLVLALLSAFTLFVAKKEYPSLKYIPPIVLLYMTVMTLASMGIFEKSDEISALYSTLKSNLLPAMLFLMLLPNKTNSLFKLGPKMTISFFTASLTLFIAFILSFLLFSLTAEEIEIFAPLAGSWMGGTANMLAVSAAVNSSESAIGITMLIDSVDYALWVMLLLMTVPLAPLFNRFSKARDSVEDIEIETQCAVNFSFRGYFWLLFSAITVSLLTQVGGIFLAKLFFGSPTIWTVILATLAGILFSFSSLGRIKGIHGTANAMLYLLIALIASRANIGFDITLLSYIFIGLCILIIHAFLMLVFARLFKLDLFSVSVASLANIGGIASAPILSAAYSQSLVGVGVLMATLGYIIGTFGALALVSVLKMLV